MIPMTKAALHYAVEVCSEIQNYKAIVYVSSHTQAVYAKEHIKNRLRNRNTNIIEADNGLVVRFPNESELSVIIASDYNARGTRCNLAIVDGNLPRRIVSSIIAVNEYYTVIGLDDETITDTTADPHINIEYRNNNTNYPFDDPWEQPDRADAPDDNFVAIMF